MSFASVRRAAGRVAVALSLTLLSASSFAQTSWTEYVSNPVLSDVSNNLKAPSVVYDSTAALYKMWYEINDNTFGYATSSTGVAWTPGTAAFTATDVGISGATTPQIHSPSVTLVGSNYYMWFSAKASGSNDGAIYRATSTDGATWTQDGVVLAVSGANIDSVSVIKDGLDCVLICAVDGGSVETANNFRRSTSTDGGATWATPTTVLTTGGTGDPDSDFIGDPDILSTGDVLRLWYAGVDASVVGTICYATSTDNGLTWTKSASNPVIENGSTGDWNQRRAVHPDVMLHGGEFQMWYGGLDGSWAGSLGYATSRVQVSVGTAEAVIGGPSVQVPINISDISGLGLISVDLVVDYDTDNLTFNSIGTTGLLTDGWTSDHNENLGLIDIGLADADAASGAGGIVNILFTPKTGSDIGLAAVSITSIQLNENAILASTSAGGVNISGELKYGDVSADGNVGALDATELLQHAVGKITEFTVESVNPPWWGSALSPTEAMEIADVSNNDSATAYDAALILQYTLSYIESFPAEAAAPSALLADGFSYRLEGSAETVRPGDTVTLKLHLDGNGSVYSGDLAFEYDPAAFRVVDVTSPSADIAHGLVAKNTESGRLSLAIASATPLRGDDFVEVTLVASPSFRKGALGDVRLSRFDVNESRLQPTAFSFGLLAYQFRVLPNYPNPFNPETWIPFELDATSRVTVNIYGAKGELVRRMDLGVRDAGEYVDKAKSAYWDGRNEQGEVVASGLYYYEIRTESASAIRAMVIRK